MKTYNMNKNDEIDNNFTKSKIKNGVHRKVTYQNICVVEVVFPIWSNSSLTLADETKFQ